MSNDFGQREINYAGNSYCILYGVELQKPGIFSGLLLLERYFFVLTSMIFFVVQCGVGGQMSLLMGLMLHT